MAEAMLESAVTATGEAARSGVVSLANSEASGLGLLLPSSPLPLLLDELLDELLDAIAKNFAEFQLKILQGNWKLGQLRNSGLDDNEVSIALHRQSLSFYYSQPVISESYSTACFA